MATSSSPSSVRRLKPRCDLPCWAPELRGDRTRGMSKKVLVVEDHHDTSFLLCRLLKTEGFEVKHAIDGVVGFTTATNELPDLIVTDIQMPRMNGIELIRRIRE